jgi:hypothetical protein
VTGGPSGGKVVEVVMLARTALAFTTRARHRGHTDGVEALGARHRGEVRRVGTKTTAAAAA